MKKMKRIEIENGFKGGGVDYFNYESSNQNCRLAQGINEIMDCLEELSRKIDELEKREEQNGP